MSLKLNLCFDREPFAHKMPLAIAVTITTTSHHHNEQSNNNNGSISNQNKKKENKSINNSGTESKRLNCLKGVHLSAFYVR